MGKNQLNKKETILLEKYKLLIPQIIHWDTHFWSKSRFFLTIEAALLASAIAALTPILKDVVLETPTVRIISVITAISNVFLCLIWWKTNLRNLQYRRFKISEFRRIEKKMPALTLLPAAQVKLMLPKKDSTARYEANIPWIFLVCWVLILVWAIGCKPW